MSKQTGDEAIESPGLLTDEEIASVLGITRSAVFQLRHRALRKLRRAILADPVLRTMATEVCGDRAVRRGVIANATTSVSEGHTKVRFLLEEK